MQEEWNTEKGIDVLDGWVFQVKSMSLIYLTFSLTFPVFIRVGAAIRISIVAANGSLIEHMYISSLKRCMVCDSIRAGRRLLNFAFQIWTTILGTFTPLLSVSFN